MKDESWGECLSSRSTWTLPGCDGVCGSFSRFLVAVKEIPNDSWKAAFNYLAKWRENSGLNVETKQERSQGTFLINPQERVANGEAFLKIVSLCLCNSPFSPALRSLLLRGHVYSLYPTLSSLLWPKIWQEGILREVFLLLTIWGDLGAELGRVRGRKHPALYLYLCSSSCWVQHLQRAWGPCAHREH